MAEAARQARTSCSRSRSSACPCPRRSARARVHCARRIAHRVVPRLEVAAQTHGVDLFPVPEVDAPAFSSSRCSVATSMSPQATAGVERQVGRRARRLAHDEARPGHPGRRTAPSWVIDAHRPATNRLSDPLRHDHPVRKLVEAARVLAALRTGSRPCRRRAPRPASRSRRWCRGSRRSRARRPRSAGSGRRPAGSRGCRSAARGRRCRSRSKPGVAVLDEVEHVQHLPAALQLAVGELVDVGAVDGAAVRVVELGEVGAPLQRVALRPDDRLLARERVRAGRARPRPSAARRSATAPARPRRRRRR